MVSLLLCLIIQQGSSVLNIYFQGEDIQTTIPNGGSIGFGNTEDGVIVSVTSGTLNGSSFMTYWRDRGRIYVTSENTASFTVDGFGDATPIFGGGQTSEKFNKTRILGSTISGDSLVFGWGVESEPLLPFMFILGVFGVISLFTGFTWGAYKIKNGEYIDGAINALIFCSIGFGLIVGWLFS